MPLSKYHIRNEYTLADPELYRSADKDDPEALLEGVAMAGLVGVLRQLGDLAEFAAEVFHDLHEEVMATAARGHSLMARVQQLEAEVPSLEKAFLSQTHHSSFFTNGVIDWHPNLRSEQNLVTRGDLPRFIMDSYEECRGPPRLFLLDKFDVAGAGACLTRYTDPSFFKMESASSGTATVEVHRQKRIRKVKQKKGARLRDGEAPNIVPTHAKLHQLLLEERIESGYSDPARLVKLKKRQLNGSAVEVKAGKSYMEKFLETPSPDHKMVCETSIIPLPVQLMSDDTSETGIKILEISSISPVKKSLGNESTCSSLNEQELELKPFSEVDGETNGDLVKVHEKISAGVIDEMSSNHPKLPGETEFAVDEQKKIEGSLDGYHSDDVTSEVDNYMDALTTMESELETDNECRPKKSFLNIQTDTDDKEEHQLQARFSDSHSFGDSSTSDGISSFKQDRNEEHTEVQARLSDSLSTGTSSTSDNNSSFRRDRDDHIELQTHFSDSQSIGNCSTSDENSSFKKDRSYFTHSDSLSTVVESIQSEPILFISTKNYEPEIEDTPSNQLPQIVELHKTDCGKYIMRDDAHVHEEEISDSGQASSGSYLMKTGHVLCSDLGPTSPVTLPTGTQSDETPSDPITDCGKYTMHDDAHVHEEEISDSGQASSGSYLMKTAHELCSYLGPASPVTLPTGTQSDETPSDPIELNLRLEDDEDSMGLVESIAAEPVSLSLIKDDAWLVDSSNKNSSYNLDDGDPCVHSNDLLQVSNDLELAHEDECSDHSEIKVLPEESPKENSSEILVCRDIGSQGEDPICPSMEELDLNSGPKLPLDCRDSKDEDCIIETQLNLEDLSPVVEIPLVSCFTGELSSDLTHDNPQDEPDSAEIEVLYSDLQSNFEEIPRMVHGDGKSGSTYSVDPVEDDDRLKHPSSPNYIRQDNHVMVTDVVAENVQSEDQAAFTVPSVDSAENDAGIVTCPASGLICSPPRNLSNLQEPLPGSSDSHQTEMKSNEVELTQNSIDLNAEKRENQLEPSLDISSSDIICSPISNLTKSEESLFTSADPHEKEMEDNEAVARESLTELEPQKIVDQPEIASADVQLNLNSSVPFDLSDSEICNNIQNSSPREQFQYSVSVDDMKMVPEFSGLDVGLSESIFLGQNDLLQNGKDSLSFPSHNQLESETHLELFLQSQVGEQDAEFLLRDEESFASEKFQSQQMQIYQLEQQSSHATSEFAPEIHPDEPSSSYSLSQSSGQEINPTKHVMDPLKPLLPDLFPQATENNLDEMPPMPPLPPMQWRMGKFQHASLVSQREVEVSQASFQPMQPIKPDEKPQFGLPTSERETLQYHSPFLPVMAVESDKLRHSSGFSVGVSGHRVAIPFQFPIMVNETNGQCNYLVLDRTQIQNPFLTLPVVSTGMPPHDYVVASEGEMVQNSNPSPPIPPAECAVSGHDSISPQEKPTQPPSQLMTETSSEVKTLQQSISNVEGEQGDPSISTMSQPRMESMESNQSLLPSEGEMALSLDTSAETSDFESERPNGKPKNKLPRPRNPLIDAVAAHDKSKLRRVTERVRPQIEPKVDERDSLLEQIRTKSFNLKPAVATRPSIQGRPKTNLKVAAILEKANAIRQALAGSDEDDDADSWSDS